MAHEMKRSKTLMVTTHDGSEDNKHKPQIYAKNSIDRFGDDLCALLLSYFPLEDHIRCESLSKQFRRTVFRSLRDITIDDKLMRRLPKSNVRQIVATIAIKCENIETIDCRGMSSRFEEPIVEFANNATLIAKNLHTFELLDYFADNSDEHRLSAFVAHNLCLRSAVFMVYDTLPKLCQQLSRLTQLRELGLGLMLTSGQNSLSESLRTFGLDCKQLQRLTLHLNACHNLDLIDEFNSHSLDSLQCYRRLKRLNLWLNVALNPEVLEPLTLCHRLTHLTINSRKMSDKLFVNCDKQWPRLQHLSIKTNTISRECLDHISRLPALQILIIDVYVISGLTDNDFEDLLSRSPKLKAIEFIVNTNRKTFTV
ncbi:unnamed protein product [Medioppia subpectinata]|uniref:F-box domain-containing protein n=1 Tax=Medioppia subpectinata TaxID=1979941 RepID=A0A7R9KGL1_9ACAR|nr:unnamed protein product [Medioppia subpectinata]CAG2102980.1 unnamed protein product [Medioppia subpectinata]